MNPAELLRWVIANEATVGPVLTNLECTGWYCRTPRTTMFYGETLEEAVEKCRKALDKDK